MVTDGDGTYRDELCVTELDSLYYVNYTSIKKKDKKHEQARTGNTNGYQSYEGMLTLTRPANAYKTGALRI